MPQYPLSVHLPDDTQHLNGNTRFVTPQDLVLDQTKRDIPSPESIPPVSDPRSRKNSDDYRPKHKERKTVLRKCEKDELCRAQSHVDIYQEVRHKRLRGKKDIIGRLADLNLAGLPRKPVSRNLSIKGCLLQAIT